LLVGLSISLIMIGAYMAVGFASLTAPKSLWSPNPVTITFSHATGSAKAIESVKCAPDVTDVVFQISVSNPTRVSLTADPNGEATCGPAPDMVTLTASSTTPGTYTGAVTIFQPSTYRTIPPSLSVTIVAT
jgi:hypothetical protein